MIGELVGAGVGAGVGLDEGAGVDPTQTDWCSVSVVASVSPTRLKNER